MEHRNCKVCGRIFQYVSGEPICWECKENDERDFEKVRDYIKEHQGATLMEVSRENGILPKKIESYIKEEKLEVSIDSSIKILCERCKEPITTGKYCLSCKMLIIQEMQGAARELKMKENTSRLNGKMHFLNKKK